MATRKKAKKLRVQEVKSIAQAVRKDVGTDVDLKDKILESISKMKQLAVFPERQQLYSILTSPDMRPAYEKLVSSLLEDYLKLFSSIKGQAKYLDFQVVWLDHIRRVGEQGYSLATCDAQPFFDGESDSVTFDSGALDAWSEILSSALADISPFSPETNFIMLHTIAREVYDHQQQKIYEKKTTPPNLPHPVSSEDGALFRMCGAEVARMMNVRANEKKRKLEHVDKCHPKVQSLDRQMDFLRKMCIPIESKETMKDSIPASIQHLDKGGMYIPLPSLKPFLQQVEHVFTKHVNNESFQTHGDQLFKVADSKLTEEIPSLFQLFTECLESDHNCPQHEIEQVHRELTEKMFNLRKEDWKQSFQRVHLDKKGKTSAVTLMLRDELKPIAASK